MKHLIASGIMRGVCLLFVALFAGEMARHGDEISNPTKKDILMIIVIGISAFFGWLKQ